MDNLAIKLVAESTPIARKSSVSYLKRRSTFGHESGTSTGKERNSMFEESSFGTPKQTIPFESFLGANTSVKMSTFNNNLEPPLLMDITEDNSTSVCDDSPTTQVSSLFQDFLELYQRYGGEHEIFTLLLQYEEVCSEKIRQLLHLINKSLPIQQKYDAVYDILECMRNERNTWRLIRTLYQDRILVENINEDKLMLDTMGQRLSDKQIVENLFAKNSYIRQCQLVVDWLEKNAAEDLAHTHLDKMEYFTTNSTSWENTLHILSRSKSILCQPTSDYLITELDPDAPIRQQNSILHAADKEDEDRLLKFMFISVRAGNLEEAQRMAENFGQPWLAASLEGWRLYHDPNYGCETLVDGDTLLPAEGNKYRDIWKIACWRITKEPRISVHQQALYGVLSGNLEAIIRACSTWCDYLWAYAKVSVDQRTEQELRLNTESDRPLEDLPADYWDKILDFEQIFQELNACESQQVRKEGQGYHQIMQKYIILDDIDGLIETLYNWVKEDQKPSAQLLRIVTHIILFFRMIGRCSKEELCISVLEAYVQELISQRQISLVAPYTSTLPQAHQVIWYAKFLEGITDNSERELCLKFAEESGLDVPLIVKTVVENVRTKVSASSETPIVSSATTEDDLQKINSIDWLIFDPALRAEAMWQANSLMRVFVANEKLDAARETFVKLPADSINLIMKQSKLSGHAEIKPNEDNAIREYLCFKAYLEAFDAFNDWFHHFQHAKPKCPEPPSGSNVKFVEKVAHEHEMRRYETELQRWENAHMAQTKTTTDRLYNVLLFVNGGWMVDQRMDGIPDERRATQMKLLRKLCIPQVTKLLHKVLHCANLHKECIQISDIIASERHQLYKEFSAQELQDLLSSLRESSLILLSQNLDPLGYPLQTPNESFSS